MAFPPAGTIQKVGNIFFFLNYPHTGSISDDKDDTPPKPKGQLFYLTPWNIF
jgi:hypothetical protein